MDIRIGKCGRHCAGTNVDFKHDDELMSLIRVLNKELVREDYLKSAWSSEYAAGAVATWASKYIDPEIAGREPAEAYSPLRQVFYDAVESGERLELAVAYLAAQLLRRQKVFRLIKEAEDSEGLGRLTLFSDRIANKLIEVRDPNITYAEMEDGRAILMDRLMKLESPEESKEEQGAAVVES